MSQGFTKSKLVNHGNGLTKVNVNGVRQDVSSGTSFDVTGIPSGVKLLHIGLKELDLSGTEHLVIQLGTSGGFVTSGYLGSASRAASHEKNTGGIEIFIAAAAENMNGVITLMLMDEATHTWCASYNVGSSDTTAVTVHGGFSVPLSGELTQIRFKSESANTFADGSVNVLYDNPDPATVTDSAMGVAVQTVHTQDGEVATGTTTIPLDDTIPQNTEGDEYMTASITPTNAANKLKIEVVVNLAHSSASVTGAIAALFQDSTANALACAYGAKNATANDESSIIFTHWMTAGTASSTTFKVRAGTPFAGTTTFNGASSARLFGGAMASSITITEYKA